MKGSVYDSDQLLEIAFQEFTAIPVDKLNELRNSHRYHMYFQVM
jgi:hypothetical protein